MHLDISFFGIRINQCAVLMQFSDQGMGSKLDTCEQHFFDIPFGVFGPRQIFLEHFNPKPRVNALLQNATHLFVFFQHQDGSYSFIVSFQRCSNACTASPNDNQVIVFHRAPFVLAAKTKEPLCLYSTAMGSIFNSRDNIFNTSSEQKAPWQRPAPARVRSLVPTMECAPTGR